MFRIFMLVIEMLIIVAEHRVYFIILLPVLALIFEDCPILSIFLKVLVWNLLLLMYVLHRSRLLLGKFVSLLLLLLLGVVWWSPWSILFVRLNNLRLAFFVEFALCYESIALVFLILIVLLVMLILWKKLFRKN
jgi:hypothetical protein